MGPVVDPTWEMTQEEVVSFAREIENSLLGDLSIPKESPAKSENEEISQITNGNLGNGEKPDPEIEEGEIKDEEEESSIKDPVSEEECRMDIDDSQLEKTVLDPAKKEAAEKFLSDIPLQSSKRPKEPEKPKLCIIPPEPTRRSTMNLRKRKKKKETGYEKYTNEELREILRERKISGISRMRKDGLIAMIVESNRKEKQKTRRKKRRNC